MGEGKYCLPPFRCVSFETLKDEARRERYFRYFARLVFDEAKVKRLDDG